MASQEVPAILKEAFWIWPDSFSWDLYNCYALFRKAFFLKSVPRRAPFFITADQSYQLYVNGEYVCRGPARGYQKSWPFDEVDLSRRLKKGRNVIAIRAYNPGRSNFQYIHQGYAGLLAAAEWNGVRIVTDRSWKCRRQNGISRITTQTSLQLFPQENIDLAQENPRWMLPSYKEGGEWQPREFPTSVWNGMPWSGLEARGIPLLDETIVGPRACIGRAEGRSRPDWRSTRNLAINRFAEGLAHEPDSLPVERLRFATAAEGRWKSYLIDFGRVTVGAVILRINNAKGGEAVETFHAETLKADCLEPDFLPEAHGRMAFAHRLICRAGNQEHQFYHTFGFRYMILTVRDNKAPITVSVRLRQAIYPHNESGRFRSSDKNLEKIWETCAWTQRICSMDAYVDTPWREQAQWWGDARVQAWNTFHLSGDPRLLRRGIRQIATQTTPSGVTYGHAPTMAHNCVLPDFTLIWMATLWDDYWQTGSLESFLSQRHTLEGALSYFDEWTDPRSGLLRYDDRYWLFLDWTGIQKEGCSTVYSSWLMYALDRVGELYRMTGQQRPALRCKRWSSRLRKALLTLQQRDGLIADGILPNGKINKHCSIHSQTLALMNRLSPPSDQAFVERSLLPHVRGELDCDIMPSAYWITYVYTELAIRGYGRDVVADIKRRWARMAEYGSTFETFNSQAGNESRSHAWSAHPLFHLMQILGGIRQSAAAWTHISFAPLFLGNHAEVSIPSPRGEIQTAWQRSDSSLAKGSLRLPDGVRASVHLPGKANYTIEGPCQHRFTANFDS